MRDLQTALAELRELARNPTEIQAAEDAMAALIDGLSALELSEAEGVIRDAINAIFLPKRRKRLIARIHQGLEGTRSARVSESTPKAVSVVEDAVAAFRSDLRLRLIEVADRHIFQWPYYEAFASDVFDIQVPRARGNSVELSELTPLLREEVASHCREVLKRGFVYAIERQDFSRSAATDRLNANLVKLLGIAVSEYRRQLGKLRSVGKAAELRGVASAMITGMLLGRCRAGVSEGRSDGEQVLELWKLWVQYLPFITLADLEQLGLTLPMGEIRSRLYRVAQPLGAALDEQVRRTGADQVGVLRGVTYSTRFDRLELTLVEPIRAADKEIVFHCYLSDPGADRSEIESAFHRGMQLILAPLSDDLARWLWRQDPAIGHRVIDTAVKDASDRVRDLLTFALADVSSGNQQDVPITYNFARRFPLDNPDIGADFRVTRRSVRALLEQHHSATGVRLWCSVRRSGKTTACVDLQSHRGSEIVITETCERTGSANLKDSFYRSCINAVHAGSQLPADFVSDAIRSAAEYPIGKSKIIFVLDEYESLFRQLENEALANESIRYRVVQPLLNQIVEFARKNLVILLGLRPDAHFILMEQNQLSPYVRSDPFPLFDFERNRPDCEFRELVQRVLTDRIPCDDGFLGHLYAETGGHPVLTVNVLTSLCDWLIKTARPLSRLRLKGPDFEDFAKEHLTAHAIALSDVYDVHRKFAQQGLSDRSRKLTPWIYAVLHVLRHIASQPEDRMACAFSDVARLVERLGLDKDAGIDAQDLIRTGTMANFFRVTDRTVKPRIRLYARLTAAVVPMTRL